MMLVSSKNDDNLANQVIREEKIARQKNNAKFGISEAAKNNDSSSSTPALEKNHVQKPVFFR